jgi:hypothetical protein
MRVGRCLAIAALLAASGCSDQTYSGSTTTGPAEGTRVTTEVGSHAKPAEG